MRARLRKSSGKAECIVRPALGWRVAAESNLLLPVNIFYQDGSDSRLFVSYVRPEAF